MKGLITVLFLFPCEKCLQSTLDKWNLHGTEQTDPLIECYTYSNCSINGISMKTRKVPLIKLLSYLISLENRAFVLRIMKNRGKEQNKGLHIVSGNSKLELFETNNDI